MDTPCLARTSAQHIQREPSQISLCYFKPTKDTGPLPTEPQIPQLPSTPRTLGHFPLTNLPGDTGSQLGSYGGWSAESCRLGAQASEGASPAQSGAHNSSAEWNLRARKLRFKTRLGYENPCPLHSPSPSLGITEGLQIWGSSP